ncbi:MAG: N-acetylglucosaminyldiphosphoundecaprenol N-acetyl-beta-D-mannosaminyltransferase [Glaciecola sp.]|jgi:N-acetylglucosaminyldiphosphoundecaprenol N-acetyl-beta-D-mannosaminyltransferase
MKLEDVTFTNVGGLKTACVDRKQLVDLMVHSVNNYHANPDDKKPLIVFDSNGHGISLANTDLDFNYVLAEADIIHADGQSVVAMSKWTTGAFIPERSATTDTIHDIPTMCDQNISHFLFGGSEEVVEKCAHILSQKYANFSIAGTLNGYFSDRESDAIIETINAAKPDVLWVGLGKPKEQQWIIENRQKLNFPVIISCGGCYNYVTGDYARAPQWMQNAGLEWLHRAATEPRKFLWRYLTTNPHSIYCVLKHKFKAEKL